MNSVSISEKGLNLGQCGTKKRNDWKNDFWLTFVSDGTDDMAICEVEADIGGNFGSMKYRRTINYRNYDYESVWSNDDYGKLSIAENWGPISRIGAVKQNQIRIKSVKLDFCVSNCDNGIAEYISNDISDEYFFMKNTNGLNVPLSLKDTRKGSPPKRQKTLTF